MKRDSEMNHPCNPEGPHGGRGHFGFGPMDRHTRHQLRDAVLDQVRAQRGGFGFGPGGFGPGFGPGFGLGAGFGTGGRRGGRGSGRGPGRRGDVRAAILSLLVERPMHGYEMIQEIAERSNGLWKPSPGSVYPTLQLLEDEGLIVTADAEGSKKLFELTEDGRAAAEKIEVAPWTEIAEGADPCAVGLRDALGQLFGAAAQAVQAGGPDQQQRVLDVINEARREIYQILGES